MLLKPYFPRSQSCCSSKQARAMVTQFGADPGMHGAGQEEEEQYGRLKTGFGRVCGRTRGGDTTAACARA